MASDRTVVALFARSEDAHRAINKLIDSGVSPDRIGYLEPVDEQDMKNPGTTAGKGIAAGAASGAVIGGLLAAAAVALIPAVGPALVGGACCRWCWGRSEGRGWRNDRRATRR